MKKKAEFLSAVILLVLFLVSCSSKNLQLDSLSSGVCVSSSDSSMSLEVYFHLSERQSECPTIIVTSPDGSLTWQVPAQEVEYEKEFWYGYSNLSYPSTSALPKGTYSLEVLLKDGSTKTSSFDVDYNDVSGALDRAAASQKPYFDTRSNIVVL